jgi:lipoprotein-anchoring transpeptidase ErfK/SrfK
VTEAGESQDSGPETQTLTRFILISIPDRKLALIDDGVVVKVYDIAVGTDGTPSPTGDYTIINRIVDPVYYHEGKTIPAGKNNPVGSRWMGLSLKGYGIHGTNVQSSVGKAASHGCFRMKKKDVEELFTLVKVGDVVSIRGERDEVVMAVFHTNEKPAETNVAKNGGAPETADGN